MRGNAPTIQGVHLDLHELVLPYNLLSGEEILSSDDEVEEETPEPYRVATTCGICHNRVRIFVLADEPSIRHLQQLLLENLRLVCVSCARTANSHGK